ncbi:MAG TPA: hypothetical protein VG188_13005 [Solirubrobacteraceae bacterium]|jgi:hypothetical protein|nr:hypothetical protein [Solirubrobacteraceae bacterium]
MADNTEQSTVSKAKKGADTEAQPEQSRRKRTLRPYPASSFKEAAELAEAMVEIAGGSRSVRRITLFDHLKRSPESGPGRQLVTNSARYGLTEGSYQSEALTLTENGLKAVNPEGVARERARARFQLAIAGIPAFQALYERFSNARLPTQQVMRDFLVSDQKLSEDDAKKAVELFIINVRDVGMLKTLSGAERILTLDHMLDDLPPGTEHVPKFPDSNGLAPDDSGLSHAGSGFVSPADLQNTCFYITPIGEEDSEERDHADLLLGQIVEPAIEALGLDLVVVRADKLTQPGMISQQILQHVLGARLVVADLSFHNPNVFYELAIRHATKGPTVLISRTAERVPFDIADLRVVRLDMTDIYSFVPRIEAWRAELTQHARQALEHPDTAVTPITLLGGALTS